MDLLIFALTLPNFQQVLFPRDADLDDFLAARFPLVYRRVGASTKEAKIARWLLEAPHDQVSAALRQHLNARVIALLEQQASAILRSPTVDAPSALAEPAQVGLPITEIFRLRGLCPNAYVEPDQAEEVRVQLQTPMLTLLVEGPSGVGKSTVVEQALRRLNLMAQTVWISSTSEQDKAELDRVLDLEIPSGSYLVVDDFHLLDRGRQERLTRLVKLLASPRPGKPASGKLTLIGINPVSASLLSYMHDVRGCYKQVKMVRQSDETIQALIRRCSELANVQFAAAEDFVHAALGNFVIAQRLCLEGARLARISRIPERITSIPTSIKEVISGVQVELHGEFAALVRAFASFDEQAPPRGACLLLLWHLARANNAFVPFDEVQYRDAALRPAFEWLLRSNLGGFFQRNPGLPTLLYYNRDAGVLSAEDPQLQFYLRHLDWQELARATNHRIECWDPIDGPLLQHETPRSEPQSPSTSSSRVLSPPATVSARSPMPLSGHTPVRHSHILHLSDLHFSSADQAIPWHNQLAADLKHELSVTSLDALIVSGDIANTAEPIQYEAASRFFQELSNEFGLSPRQIILVPGNHDVSWKQAKRAYIPMRREDYAGSCEKGAYIEEGKYIELRDDALYKRRFEPFAKFYETVRTEEYSLDYPAQATVHHFPDQNLLVVGLNSAWYVDHHFKERAGLHPGAVSRALSQIRTTPDYAKCTKFAVFHHPPHQFKEPGGFDGEIVEQLAQAGFQFALHGHIHAAKNDLFRYYREVKVGHLELLSAGTFGAPTHELRPGYPFQYQMLEITSSQLTVHTRRREEVAGAWKPDARWLQRPGKDPLPRYQIELGGFGDSPKSAATGTCP